MDNFTLSDIVKLNKEFYESNASDFSVTRAYPWRGWGEILPLISEINPLNILDLGCGNGRFYSYLFENLDKDFNYLGIDFSNNLINEAIGKYSLKDANHEVKFEVRDFLEDIGSNENAFKGGITLVVGFGIMHHIFQRKNQVEFVKKCLDKLSPNGLLILTFWMRGPAENSITQNLGENDFILNWDKNNSKKRFVHIFKSEEAISIVKEASKDIPIKFIKKYFQDGKDEDSNLYIVAQKL